MRPGARYVEHRQRQRMKLVEQLAWPDRGERKEGAEDLGAAPARPHKDRAVPPPRTGFVQTKTGSRWSSTFSLRLASR